MATVIPHGDRAFGPAARPLPSLRAPQVVPLGRRNLTAAIVLWLLAAICLMDLNALIYQTFGAERAFSFVILGLCLIVLIINRLTIVRDLGKAGWFYTLFLFAYFAIGTLINIRTGDPEMLLVAWYEMRFLLAGYLLSLALAVGVSHFASGYSIKWAMRMLYAVALIVPASIYLGFLFPQMYINRPPELAGRYTGFYGNPNEAGIATCITAAIGFACLTYERRRVLCIAGLAASAVACLMTFSRGSILAFILLTLFQVWGMPNLRRLWIVFAAAILLGGIGLFSYQATTGQRNLDFDQQNRMDRLIRIVTKFEISEETTGGRIGLALSGIRHWLESPLIGHGLGQQRYIGSDLGSHNSFIRVLGEAGIIPGFWLAVFLVVAWRESRKCKIPPIRALTSAYWLLLVVACMTNHGVLTRREHNAMMGVCFGMLVAAKALERAAAARNAPRRAPPAANILVPAAR